MLGPTRRAHLLDRRVLKSADIEKGGDRRRDCKPFGDNDCLCSHRTPIPRHAHVALSACAQLLAKGRRSCARKAIEQT